MLQYFRLKNEIQETNTIVSFDTFEAVRVDISKKFIKKDQLSGRWYFTRPAHHLQQGKMVMSKTYITLGDVYIVECREPLNQSDVNSNPVFTVQDLISFKEVNTFRGNNNAEETYRS